MRHAMTLLLMAALAGCVVVPAPRTGPPPLPSVEGLYAACRMAGCREPNRVVAELFADLAAEAGGGCIAHVFPADEEPPWPYWHEYMQPLRRLGAYRVRLIAPSKASRGRTAARLRALEQLYAYAGARSVEEQWLRRPQAFSPPYRPAACAGYPVMEVVTSARLVSARASHLAEGRRAASASVTLLAVLER